MRHFGAIFGIVLLSAVAVNGQLAIVQPVAAQYDGGPATPAGFAFASGESIFLSFDIAGFKAEGDEDLKLNVSWECQAFDAAGLAMTAVLKGDVKVDLAPEDKKWRPRVRAELVLPQAMASGAAEIRISAADHVGGGKAALLVPFRTRGLDLGGGDKLRALRFRFVRTEQSNAALAVPAYAPGDTVWGRFEIAGYKLGDGNTYQVSYGLEVFRANGESLYRQEEAASETGKSFYPRRYVTGTLSLELTKDLAPGEYSILLRVRDGAGNRESESRHSFRVE